MLDMDAAGSSDPARALPMAWRYYFIGGVTLSRLTGSNGLNDGQKPIRTFVAATPVTVEEAVEFQRRARAAMAAVDPSFAHRLEHLSEIATRALDERNGVREA